MNGVRGKLSEGDRMPWNNTVQQHFKTVSRDWFALSILVILSTQLHGRPRSFSPLPICWLAGRLTDGGGWLWQKSIHYSVDLSHRCGIPKTRKLIDDDYVLLQLTDAIIIITILLLFPPTHGTISCPARLSIGSCSCGIVIWHKGVRYDNNNKSNLAICCHAMLMMGGRFRGLLNGFSMGSTK